MKKMSMSALTSASGPQVSDHNLTNNYAPPYTFNSQAPRGMDPSSDTFAVLEQLAAIQRVISIIQFYALGTGD